MAILLSFDGKETSAVEINCNIAREDVSLEWCYVLFIQVETKKMKGRKSVVVSFIISMGNGDGYTVE